MLMAKYSAKWAAFFNCPNTKPGEAGETSDWSQEGEKETNTGNSEFVLSHPPCLAESFLLILSKKLYRTHCRNY